MAQVQVPLILEFGSFWSLSLSPPVHILQGKSSLLLSTLSFFHLSGIVLEVSFIYLSFSNQ